MLKCGERLLFKSVEIANSFAQHFRCIPSPTPTSLEITITPAQSVFKFQRISEESVLKKLVTLDGRKTTGSDKISAKLLKLVAPSIAHSLGLWWLSCSPLGGAVVRKKSKTEPVATITTAGDHSPSSTNDIVVVDKKTV